MDVILLSTHRTVYWEGCFNKSKALKVSIAPDFYEGAFRWGRCEKHYSRTKFDVVFGYGTIILDHFEKYNVGKYRYCLPQGVCTEFFKKHDVEKVIDVLASYTVDTIMSDVYPYRARIQEIITEMPITVYTGKTLFDDLVEITNMSKIVVNSNARYNFVTPRVTETMACGSFLLTSYCDDQVKFGYKEGEHLVTFRNMVDFKDKVEYFLKHDKEREEIAENGIKFVRENYSNKRRVEKMFDKIRKHL